MRKQDAETLIPLPLSEVRTRLADVESWSEFLIGVAGVTKVGHERYLFRLADGNDRRDVRVVVRHGGDGNLITWRSLEGPRFVGSFQLRAVDERHTAMTLVLSSQPGTLAAGLSEMVMPRMGRAAQDLMSFQQFIGV